MSDRNNRAIAVLTSGGDAPGMNPAVRAVVRTGIAYKLDVYAVYEGYQGLIEDRIVKMNWSSVSGIIGLGGTVIGTARSKEFMTREGELKAAENLIRRGIDNLIVIGGDGSLTGANIFSTTWGEITAELEAQGRITAEQRQAYPELRIIGMVGSIDNDMANSDMTIGADTALHRIVDAIDALRSTAFSHQRTFVVEVMGRNCGYLALMSAIATGASWVFIPEHPPEDTWREDLCTRLEEGKVAGRRDNIIIIAEGARDSRGEPITSAMVKETIESALHIECRVTILGHVQRGGAPSAYDRYMSTAYGYEAVQELLKEDPTHESKIIVSHDNRVVKVPLVETVKKTKAIAAAVASGKFAEAESMRGIGWSQISELVSLNARVRPDKAPDENSPCIAVMTAGWPAPGMNSALRTIIRTAMNSGFRVLGVEDGVAGLISGKFRSFEWMEVDHWAGLGGTRLGTNRSLPEERDFYNIAVNLDRHNVKGLIILGGWTAFAIVNRLHNARPNFEHFNIPMLCIPATINNNLPGAEITIGSDTALNTIVEALDKIKTSADSARRLFTVEVMGRYCGYLALLSGMATGAEYVYMHEMGVNVDMLQKHTRELVQHFRNGRRTALIIRNENANPTYDLNFISSLFEEEGDDFFDVRQTILGPMQQGGKPSPFDRALGARLGFSATRQMIKQIREKDNTCGLVGQTGGEAEVFDYDSLIKTVSVKWQRPLFQWWERYYVITHTLAILPPGAVDLDDD